MNILLVGEYSRLHNSLKEGLIKLGHNVTILASGDGFKDYPVDIKILNSYNSGFKGVVKKLVYLLTRYDISQIHIKKQVFKHSNILKEFDVVQLINENPFLTSPKIETQLFDFFNSKCDKIFLLSCGVDYTSVKFAADEKLKYSILSPLNEKKISIKKYSSILKYLKPSYFKLHKHIFNNIDGVIASDIDYHLPLQGHPKYLGLIPNPINLENTQYILPKIEGKIIIFHGINSKNYYKKGNDIFEEALKIIRDKYNDKIEVITTHDVPYSTYRNLYNSSHIILDQIYAYDQGYNALEAMAKGKVVFTGAESEWLQYYDVTDDTIAINTLPDAKYIAKKLEWLIRNPEQIITISKNARTFIENEHNYIDSAKKYLQKWNN